MSRGLLELHALRADEPSISRLSFRPRALSRESRNPAVFKWLDWASCSWYFYLMTRSEAITVITSRLASLGDEGLSSLAEHAEDLGEAGAVRQLTERELALVEQAKADFAAGRTYTMEEARLLFDAFIAGLRAKYPNAS
jgi:hypothetical protein